MTTSKLGATFSWRALTLLLDKHAAKGDCGELKIISTAMNASFAAASC